MQNRQTILTATFSLFLFTPMLTSAVNESRKATTTQAEPQTIEASAAAELQATAAGDDDPCGAGMWGRSTDGTETCPTEADASAAEQSETEVTESAQDDDPCGPGVWARTTDGTCVKPDSEDDSAPAAETAVGESQQIRASSSNEVEISASESSANAELNTTNEVSAPPNFFRKIVDFFFGWF